MPARQHILVVDDERRVRDMLQRYLEQEGFRVTQADGGRALRVALAAGDVDLVLLDLVMPEDDGLELAREIRNGSRVPIIMLTGRGDMVDRVVGLEIGADDYIAKPFHLREVLARMRSVLRRAAAAAAAAVSQPGEEAHYSFAGWRLDPGARTLMKPDGETVELSRGEFDLLMVFLQRPQRPLSREILMDLAKGRGYDAFDRAIDAQISRLRKKIEADPAQPRLIKSVRGVGYLFGVPVSRG